MSRVRRQFTLLQPIECSNQLAACSILVSLSSRLSLTISYTDSNFIVAPLNSDYFLASLYSHWAVSTRHALCLPNCEQCANSPSEEHHHPYSGAFRGLCCLNIASESWQTWNRRSRCTVPPFEERDHFIALGEAGRKVLVGCLDGTDNMRLNGVIMNSETCQS